MVAVDTNVLVRYFVKDDVALARRAEKIIQTAGTTSLLLDRLILCELNYVLRSVYRYSQADISRILEVLFGDERFTIVDRPLVEYSFRLFVNEGPLSAEDAWLLALKRTGQVDAVATFDAALAKRAES